MKQPFVLGPVPDSVSTSVSIVVPCRNAVDTTMQSLTSLLNNTDLPFELVLVNDGSTDATAASLDGLVSTLNAGNPLVTRAVALHLPMSQGCSSATNLGMSVTTGAVIVWCNNDMLYCPDWLSPLVKIAVSHADVGVVGPWPVDRQTAKPFFSAGMMRFTPNVIPNDPYLASAGAPWVFRREVLGRVGGFLLDTRFNPFYFEDWDFYNRLLTAGLHFGLTRRSSFYHYGGVTCTQYPNIMEVYLKNRRLFLQKWPGGGPMPGYIGVTPQQMHLW